MKFFLVCGSTRSNSSFFLPVSLILLILSGLLLTACSSHPKGPPGKGILRTRQLVELLVDLHYYESVYTVAGHSVGYRHEPESDTLDYYLPVFEKHGTTREVFRESMKYYSYNPSQFEAIYDRVVDELKRRHSEAEMEGPDESFPPVQAEPPRRDQMNLWNLDRNWLFPGTDENKMISFDIPIPGPGIYTFSADIRLDPEDGSVNPAVNIWFWHDDGTEEGHVESFGTAVLRKDGYSRHITVSAQLTNPDVTHIRGRVLDMENREEGFERHAEVQDITLSRAEASALP